ncbi:MAG: helix-turn-helix domain-containing protein [Erysipelotrichaceae bacterium]|nr:helix-turn-helix domain-containing protein [Erysipelotrichaceae bacterium]
MTLKETRTSYGITQKEASKAVGVPLRTYIRYESIDDANNLKYLKIIELLNEHYQITETNGLLTVQIILKKVSEVLREYKDEITFCYLFGSYAKGYATETSDVDLCLNTSLTGLKFVGLVEKLHQSLKKNVDVIRVNDLKDNFELVKEIMKDGIKIYG